MGEAVGIAPGVDNVAAEGEPVDDRGAEPRVGEGLGPAGERFVGRDRDGVLLFPFGEDLKEELGAAAVKFHVSKLIDHKQIDPPVSGDGAGEGFVVGGFDELVYQPGGEAVSDPEALLGRGGAEADEEVRFPGSGVADPAERLPAADLVAGGEGIDGGGVDIRVSVEVEVSELFVSQKSGCFDSADGGAPISHGSAARLGDGF